MTYEERKERGICTRAGCSAKCAEVSLLCLKHWEEHKDRQRATARSRRAWLDRQLCMGVLFVDEPLSTWLVRSDSD